MRSIATAFGLVLALAPAIAPAIARAQSPAPAPAPTESPVHLQTSIGTDVPVAVSFRGDVEFPGRLRLMASVGATPSAYLSVFNGVLNAAGSSSQTSGGLLGAHLDHGTAWRVQAGWRPFAGAGFMLMGGYGRIDVGGSANARDVITAITGSAPPSSVPEATGIYDVASTLHTVTAELGWEFLFFNNHLSLLTSVGFVGTFDSRTTITPRFTSTTPGAAEARAGAQNYVDGVLQSYGFLPTFSLALGYRFM